MSNILYSSSHHRQISASALIAIPPRLGFPVFVEHEVSSKPDRMGLNRRGGEGLGEPAKRNLACKVFFLARQASTVHRTSQAVGVLHTTPQARGFSCGSQLKRTHVWSISLRLKIMPFRAPKARPRRLASAGILADPPNCHFPHDTSVRPSNSE